MFDQLETVFLFGRFWKIRNSRIFHLLDNHQCWVNLLNLGKWRHALCTSEQALIIRMYLCCELSIISILYFIHSVQDHLPHVFIEPIGFTVKSISKDIISRHYCGIGFCVKCLAKRSATEYEFLYLLRNGELKTTMKLCPPEDYQQFERSTLAWYSILLWNRKSGCLHSEHWRLNCYILEANFFVNQVSWSIMSSKV